MTTGIELVRPAALSGSAPYAYAAVTDPGRMVFTAGACPLDADGATVAGVHDLTLSADGTSIMAPQDQLPQLRMDMAGEKLGGKIGYDVLDEEEPFGVSASRAL